jgi:hypothetical protein
MSDKKTANITGLKEGTPLSAAAETMHAAMLVRVSYKAV